MYFIFSKILAFLIDPFYWMAGLLIAGLIIKKAKLKKRLFIASVVVFLLFSMPVFLNQFASRWDYYPDNRIDTTKYSCVIVLSGFAGPGLYGNGYFNGASDRFIQGAKLKLQGRAKYILITGANGSLLHNNFIEADFAREQLRQFNIPDSVILTEGQSKNTVENAAYTKIILQNKHLAPPYLLVTSAFHMRRSVATFQKAGINVIPYPCNYMAGGNFTVTQLVPSPDVIAKWRIYIKEIVGYLVLKLRK